MAAQRDDDAEPSTEAKLAALVEDVPVVLDAEPEEADGTETFDRIELVRTGLVRVYLDGDRYRLRRPFFGEFREIRTALAELNEEIGQLSDESIMVARRITLEAKDQDDTDPEAWFEWRTRNRQTTRDVNRRLSDTADKLRVEWWETTWAMLTLDDRPSDWPSWVTDQALANKLVTHWRTSPLGRG